MWGPMKATSGEAAGDREWRIRSVWSGAPIGVRQIRQLGIEESEIAPMATVGLLWGGDGAFVSLCNCGYLGGEVPREEVARYLHEAPHITCTFPNPDPPRAAPKAAAVSVEVVS